MITLSSEIQAHVQIIAWQHRPLKSGRGCHSAQRSPASAAAARAAADAPLAQRGQSCPVREGRNIPDISVD